MLYADDAGIVSRSPAGLARMMGSPYLQHRVANRGSQNDDGYRGGIRRVWLDRIGEEDGDSPDAGTGEGATTGGDTNTTSTGAGDCSSRPEVQPGPPVRIPGRPHYRRRQHHARHQPPHQNRVRRCFRKFPTEIFDRPSAPL